MTRPTIAQPAGHFPRAPFTDDQIQEDVVTNLNEHAGAIDALEAGGGGGGTGILVTSYGALGDGSTDDAPAIVLALAAAIAAHKPLLFPAPAVSYRLGATITINGTGVVLAGLAPGGSTIRFDTATRSAFSVAGTTSRLEIYNLFFQGNNSDDKTVNNVGSGVLLLDGCTDIYVHHNKFDHCQPLTSNDSLNTRRLKFYKNYLHNCSGGLHPCNDSTIEDNDFICDTIVTGANGRAQAVYVFGQQENVTIHNNRFKNIAEEDIQIRSSSARYSQRHNFRITNNYFENSNQYSIWVGCDERPDIGSFLISGNQFKNVSSCIQAQGASGIVIDGNMGEWDWEFPLTPQPGAAAINVLGGIGQPAHWNSCIGAVVTNNKMIQRHPWFGKVTIDTTPADGDTVTVGDFVYTWRTTPSVAGEVLIDGSFLRNNSVNLTQAIQGQDGLATSQANPLRLTTDCFNNYLAASYGGTDFNVVVIVSNDTFTLSSTGGHTTITAPIENRQSCGVPLDVSYCISPLVANNHFEDFYSPITVLQNYAPTVTNNVTVVDRGSLPKIISGSGNVFSRYTGNRVVHKNLLTIGVPRQVVSVDDGFPIIDDNGSVMAQEQTTPSLLGRSGTIAVGDGKAYAYLYYGREIVGVPDASTLPYRWEDGDEVFLDTGGGHTELYTFKRTAPGVGQFNTPDTLIAAINGGTTWTAAYADYVDNLAAGNPKRMIRIYHTAGGTAGNAHKLYVTRYINPTDTNYTKAKRTAQPLLVGQILRDKAASLGGMTDFAPLQGGAATLVKTFVTSPIVSSAKGVFVQGIDADSEALAPKVYQADIVSGVGFTISHAPPISGSESFFWRVN